MGIAFGLLFSSLLAWAFYTHSQRDCFEIHLSDEGTCEFVARRRTIRLHVHEVSAVKYTKDDEGSESYAVRYAGGRIGLRNSIADLPDFLARLQAMNPAVDLSSFPDSWLRPVTVTHDLPPQPARWAGLLALIGAFGCVFCVLVMVGLATGLLPERFAWLFLVGMAAAACFVFAIHSHRPSGGLSTGHALGEEWQPVERKPRRRLLRVLPVLFVVAIGVLFVIAVNEAEPGDSYPRAKDAASQYTFARPLLTETSGVWLVPLGEPRRVDISRLADELAVRYRIPVAVLPDVALPRWTLDTKDRSLVGDELIRLLGQAYRAEGRAAIIGITDYEMYGGTEFRDHVFSWRESLGHYAVVSTSPLGADAFDLLRHGHTRYVRTRKLIARNIGFLYYRRSESNDSHSLLRPSMNGVHDIDKLTEAL